MRSSGSSGTRRDLSRIQLTVEIADTGGRLRNQDRVVSIIGKHQRSSVSLVCHVTSPMLRSHHARLGTNEVSGDQFG